MHRPIVCMTLAGFTACALLFWGSFQSEALSQPIWTLGRGAESFDRDGLTDPASAQKIRAGRSLRGPAGNWGITGRVDYDFAVPESAWYEITLDGEGGEVTFIVDPGRPGLEVAFQGARGEARKSQKVGNVFLASGIHTLRIQKYFWTGFPDLRGFSVNLSPDRLATTTRAAFVAAAPLFRLGSCPAIEIQTGARIGPATLMVWTKNGKGTIFQTNKLDLPSSLAPQLVRIPTYCRESGRFLVEFGDGPNLISWRDLSALSYEVVDSRPGSQAIGPLGRTLVKEIDLSAISPDFSGGGETRSISNSTGTYRESGDRGFTKYQRTPAPLRVALPEPSWFAYRLDKLDPQHPYIVEIDYPDDTLRTAVFALSEGILSPTVAGGVDTGGEFSLSSRMLTHTLMFWPKSDRARVAFLTAHDGRRAAAGRVRVFRVDETLPPLVPMDLRGRQVLNWYEEGSNFTGIYGVRDASQQGVGLAADRWADAVRYAGGSVLVPTAVVYTFAMYPSRFNVAFSRPDVDLLQRILLAAEKRGLSVIPELHPRADELAWPYAGLPDPKPNLLVSKEGLTNYYQADGKTRNYPPFYNPLFPANQNWYVEMIGELADNYRNSPALLGISLRLMQWANPTLNNFHSLDWGYDDYTVGSFEQDTGIAVPLPKTSTPESIVANARTRYQWLMANARSAWIEWRCRKIAELYTRVRDRVRKARPDLAVYSTAYLWGPAADVTALREAGIDPSLLGKIDGVTLINGFVRYGRREPDVLTVQRNRDSLLDPGRLSMLVPADKPGAFLSSAEYLETTDLIMPPVSLGFPPGTPATWMSAAVNPSGRHLLERYAIQLAETDATIIGDGGNGYSLGQPELRDFLQEYRRLPSEHFVARADARDPVAIWELRKNSRLLFYAVNRERYPVDVSLRFSGGKPIERLLTGRREVLENQTIKLRLLPYQLVGFAAPSDQTIREVSIVPPAKEVDRVRAQTEWLQKFDAHVREDLLSKLSAQDRSALHSLALDARAAFDGRNYWRARTLIENHRLLEIYRQLDKYPPDLVNTELKPD